MMQNFNKEEYVGGYSEAEVAEAREQARVLSTAAKNLMTSEDFKIVFKHYTEDKVLEDSMKATMAAEHRPEFFESVINSIAFKAYIEELLSYVDDIEG